MTNLATKKQAATSSTRRAPAVHMEGKEVEPFLIFDANGRHVGGVEKARVLGNGYVLMKVSTGPGEPEAGSGRKRHLKLLHESKSHKASKSSASPEMKVAPSMTDLPEIAESQVMRLLEKIRVDNDERQRLRTGIASKARSSKTAKAGDPLAENKHVMEAMRAQEKLNRAQDVLSGALLKPAEFLEARGITRQSLSKAVRENRIFFIAGESGLRLYPAFFADPKNDWACLQKVSKELGDLPGASKWQFFTTKKLSLGSITPVEAIRKGQIHQVLASATGFREQ